MPIDAILVPQGAECEVVRWAVQAAGRVPEIVPLPVGPAPVRRFLDQQWRGRLAWQRVLITGLCGSLGPGLIPGDLTLYESCLELDRAPIDCDRSLSDAIEAVLPQVYPVRALTSEVVITSGSRKRQTAARHRVQVVDMESYPVLEQLSRSGIAAAVLRVVSDECDQELPDLQDSYDENGELQPAALALAMLREPFAGIRLVGSSLTALGSLARTAHQLARI